MYNKEKVRKGFFIMRILELFKNLAAIPHGSGNTTAISDYCAAFARERGFEVLQDQWNNCLIRLPATQGKEANPIVVLQGHLDMVCEKDAGVSHDFEKDPLDLQIEGDRLFAKGTTLGGDDGVAIAYGLALIEDPSIPHPPMEILFTSDEETGMDGAIGLESTWLKGRILLNLDSEEEGVFITSCAGGGEICARLPLFYEPCTKPVYRISIEGLQGGHSGAEIHRRLGNANIILAKVLAGLSCRLISINGGNKSNAIPRAAEALCTMDSPVDSTALTELLLREYGDREPDLKVIVETATADRQLDEACSKAAIGLLSSLPDGVFEWSTEIEGLVETSSNLGILTTADQQLSLLISTRSMKNAKRDAYQEQLIALLERFGFAAEAGGSYPAWEYKSESTLRPIVAEIYRQHYQKEPAFIALHAGLECGLLSEKMPGLDAVSFGPDIKEIHTPRETLSLASFQRTFEFLKAILAKL